MRSDENIDVIVVGDGHSPRTGALIACLTKFNVVSIDPQMRNKKWNIKRLTSHPLKSNEYKKYSYAGYKCIIVCVHSHAPISECLEIPHGYDEVHLINIPCCYQSDIDILPDFTYTDPGILSEKNKVEIYVNIK